jgi:hypothetical protein
MYFLSTAAKNMMIAMTMIMTMAEKRPSSTFASAYRRHFFVGNKTPTKATPADHPTAAAFSTQMMNRFLDAHGDCSTPPKRSSKDSPHPEIKVSNNSRENKPLPSSGFQGYEDLIIHYDIFRTMKTTHVKKDDDDKTISRDLYF